MYIIGICDDELMYREHIRGLCEKFFENSAEEYQCVEFATGEELLTCGLDRIHLLFLDVEMPGMSGINVLHEVENCDWVWRIVFVSNHSEMVWDSFSIKTLEFARKPVSYEQVYRWLSLMQRENAINKMIFLESMGNITMCKVEDIYFLKADRNYTVVYEKEKEYLLSGNMRSWEQKLDVPSIIRVHKSYLVNLMHIKDLSTNMLKMTNNIEIPIGRKYVDEVKKKYFAFIMSRFR